jgi:hypothetical protein
MLYGSKPTALACHPTKKVKKGEELTYFSTNILYITFIIFITFLTSSEASVKGFLCVFTGHY